MAQLVEQPIRNQQVRGSSPLIGSIHRGVAQFGSAFGSGPKGRRFKSCHLDHLTEDREDSIIFLILGFSFVLMLLFAFLIANIATIVLFFAF